MSVTIKPATQTSPGNWRLDYSSTLSSPTFYIYQDGKLIATTKQTSLQILVTAGDQPLIEIKDVANASISDAYPGRLSLAWNETPATDHYRVEEKLASVWTLRQKVSDDGRGYFKWKTRFLEDETRHEFRIIPVGTNENQGTPENLTALMVRHPDVPGVAYAYSDSTKKLTLTAG